ncbi:MAG: alpha/beta hydrolase [Rhodospirillales bacterium]|nr:alpha/beta hydrolase [Rhodospirillales bacterium]
MPFADPGAALGNYRAYPLLRSLADSLPPFAACATWPVPGADPAEKQLVRSAVPALILAGTFDPITPPAYGCQTATGLVNSHFFEFLSIGHDLLGNEPCPDRLAAVFLDDPTRAPTDSRLLSPAPPR